MRYTGENLFELHRLGWLKQIRVISPIRNSCLKLLLNKKFRVIRSDSGELVLNKKTELSIQKSFFKIRLTLNIHSRLTLKKNGL